MDKQAIQDVLNRVIELGDEAMGIGEEINADIVNGYVVADGPLTAEWLRGLTTSVTAMQAERTALEREALALLSGLVGK